MAKEMGLCDFHKMALTVVKVFYKKQKPNMIRYQDYENFNNEMFLNDLHYKFFELKTVYDSLQKHVPLKNGYVRANQASLINKKINKEIMKQIHIRNKVT